MSPDLDVVTWSLDRDVNLSSVRSPPLVDRLSDVSPFDSGSLQFPERVLMSHPLSVSTRVSVTSLRVRSY